MSSSYTTERQDERTELISGAGGAQIAPSVLVEDEPGFARAVGFFGSAAVIVGGVVIISRLLGRNVFLGYGWASFLLLIGLASLLFHAAFDRDLQFRRLYLGFGYLAIVVGAFLCVLPYEKSGDLFKFGFPFMALALLFLLAALRHEHEPGWRDFALFVLGVGGAILAAIGLVGGIISFEFLMPMGLLLALLGLVYATSFVAVRGISNDLAWRAGLGLGWVGLAVILIALTRSLVATDYLVARGGLLLIVLGLAYIAAAFAVCSDLPIVVMTRRELGAFFYSPIAYFVLFGFTLAAGINFLSFLDLLLRNRAIPEPIVQYYIVSLWPVFSVVIAVPVLTMRLLSEEQRTGTLEVLLTAPVSEVAVVLSKFFAALLMFLMVCVPFGLLLIALRMMSGQAFDPKPLLAFMVGMTVTGAAFTAMGLFFSALTRNQVASAVLTFVVMLGWTFVYVAKEQLNRFSPDSPWAPVLSHISFLDVWIGNLEGKIQLNLLLFHVSLAIVCLFMTVKWLEARKWR